jgi:hypothetical protein
MSYKNTTLSGKTDAKRDPYMVPVRNNGGSHHQEAREYERYSAIESPAFFMALTVKLSSGFPASMPSAIPSALSSAHPFIHSFSRTYCLPDMDFVIVSLFILFQVLSK